ncbi:MAG: Tail-specific protease precursor [Pseudomonadota bacterium]
MKNVSCNLAARRPNSRFFAKQAIYLAFGLASFLGGEVAWALDCSQVNQLTKTYFNIHFSFSDWSDDLSRRTLDNFIKAWDSGKIYFLQADVDKFAKEFGDQLDDMIKANNCKAITDITNLFAQRFAERDQEAAKQIEAKHDFTVDEYLEFDRKNQSWATTTEEINDRWRKRVKFQLLQLKESLSDVGKAREKLIKRYKLAGKRQQEMTMDDVYSLFLSSFATALDPHSGYLAAEELEDFRIQTRLSLEGIGAVLRSEDGFTTIQSIVPGGAAAQTGKLKADDKIIAVAQGKEAPVDVIDMELREVVKLIRGTRGTEVRLTILREAKGKSIQLVVPVVRDKIQLTDRAAKSKVYRAEIGATGGQPARKISIGVISLPSFYMDFEGRQNRESNFTSSSADMLRELKKMREQKVDGVVVDLRSNGGGSLDEAINVAGLFTGKGPQVQIRGSDGKTFVQQYKDGAAAWDGPLAVVINRQSASASEIFAGAIQDYGRGVIIGGHHTFGKGTVQNLENLDERLGAIKVTISKFYRPAGSSTQLRGVESDIVLPDLMDELEIGEKHYDYALPWEKIGAAEFKTYNEVLGHVPVLRTASNARVAKDPGFKKILSDIKEFRDGEPNRNRVSLKEKVADAKGPGAEKASGSKARKRGAKASGKGGSNQPVDSDDINEPGENQNAELDVRDDFVLQESIRVAADYVQLLQKMQLAEVRLPEVGPSKLLAAEEKKQKKAKAEQMAKGKSSTEAAPLPDKSPQRPPASGSITTGKEIPAKR